MRRRSCTCCQVQVLQQGLQQVQVHVQGPQQVLQQILQQVQVQMQVQLWACDSRVARVGLGRMAVRSTRSTW